MGEPVNFICVTCGVQHAAGPSPPDRCAICEDERQYVRWSGQAWTTLADLRAERRIAMAEQEAGLIQVATAPSFAIGQHALLVRSPDGNLLWDCTSLVDDAAVAHIASLGGLRAIAVSHPHFYSSIVEWSRAFGGIPVYLHADDRDWVMRPDPCIEHWSGDALTLWDGIQVIRCGGHFAGASVLHWPAGAGGDGVLLTGDTIAVASDRRWVSFMRSYPNLIPLGPGAITQIRDALAPLRFERLYSGWDGDIVAVDAHGAVQRSAQRYLAAIEATSALAPPATPSTSSGTDGR